MIVSLQEVQQIQHFQQHVTWPAAPATSLTAEGDEMIAFGGRDSHIRLAASTQRGTFEEIAAFRAPHDGLHALAFGATTQLFSGHKNGFVVAYVLPECVMQAQQHVEDHFDGVRSLLWLSQRSLLAVTSRFSIQLLDADTLQRTRLVRTGHEHVWTIAVGQSMLASSWEGGAINFFDAATTFERVAHIAAGHSAYMLEYSPNQRRLLVAARDCIAVYAVDDAHAAVSIERRVPVDDFVVQAIAWLDDEHVVGVGNGQMAVWRATRGDRLAHWSRVQPSICRSLAALSCQRLVTDNDGGKMYIYRLYNLRGECDATAALYRASLLVFSSLRRTALGAHAMQLIAEAVADDCRVLSEHERTRIFTAARVSRRVRAARLTTLASMDSDCERMQWLLQSAPLYAFDQLAPLGAIASDDAAVEPESSAWFCNLV